MKERKRDSIISIIKVESLYDLICCSSVCFYSSEVATLLSATQKSVRCPPSALSASTYFKSTFNLSIIVHQQPEHTDSQPARPLHQYCAKTHTHTNRDMHGSFHIGVVFSEWFMARYSVQHSVHWGWKIEGHSYPGEMPLHDFII